LVNSLPISKEFQFKNSLIKLQVTFMNVFILIEVIHDIKV